VNETPPEIGRNRFDEWCWRRGIELKPAAAALGVSIETIRKIRMPFSDDRRRVPVKELAERIYDYTGGAVVPADFYPPHMSAPSGGAFSDQPEAGR